MTSSRDHNEEKIEMEMVTPESVKVKSKMDILYTVTERPPWAMLIVLAFQQFLTMFGATFSYPLLMSKPLCIDGDPVGLSKLISTVIFVAGLSTLLQTTLGARLPIIQSVSYSFVPPFMVLLALPQWQCKPCVNDPALANENNTICGSEEHVEMWESRLRELQGALLVSSVLQVVVGFTGLVGFLMNFIGPLTISPTIATIGLSLFDSAAFKTQGQWWIAITALVLVAIFSQYLRYVSLPFCTYRQGRGCMRSSIRFFALFPVLLAIVVSWLLCYILTVTDALPSDPNKWGYLARTDVQGDALDRAPWFRFPYPGQWGVPTVSVAGVLGCMAAIIASIVESVGDYHACARLSGASPPPNSAISRGIGMEGITTMLAGAWGVGGGTTSYSENIGAIGITKVGSLVVVQVSGLLMIVFGCVGKFSALFTTLPEPIVGGLFLAMFGMVTAVGISNLQFVDLNSTRNLFILGVSLFMGLCAPKWLGSNPGAIDTGTKEERGLTHWGKNDSTDIEGREFKAYDIPLIQPYLNRLAVTRYLPFCNGYRGDRHAQTATDSAKEANHADGKDHVNQGYDATAGADHTNTHL